MMLSGKTANHRKHARATEERIAVICFVINIYLEKVMYTAIFGFIWGFVTAALGVGWFDGDLLVASAANIIPIAAVAFANL